MICQESTEKVLDMTLSTTSLNFVRQNLKKMLYKTVYKTIADTLIYMQLETSIIATKHTFMV